MKRPVPPSPLGNNPSTTAETRWALIPSAIDAAGVDPIDVAMAVLDTLVGIPGDDRFVQTLMTLLTAARGHAAVRRGEPCDCDACKAEQASTSPVSGQPEMVYFVPSVQGDES